MPTMATLIRITSMSDTTRPELSRGTDHPDFERRVRESFGRQQAMTTIGASLGRVAAGEVEVILAYAPAVTQQHGFIHGGIVAMIADSSCGYAALSLMPKDAAVLTTEFKINLMAPAKGERLIALGRVVRPGRTLTVCMSEVFAEEAGSPQIHCADDRVDDDGAGEQRPAGLEHDTEK